MDDLGPRHYGHHGQCTLEGEHYHREERPMDLTPAKDPTAVDAIERRLVQSGKSHRRAKLRMDVARDEMYDAIRDARAAKLPMRAVADLAGVSLGLVQQVATGAPK